MTDSIAREQAVRRVRELLAPRGPLCALIETFGCQQNEADSDKLRGLLIEMGYRMTDDREQADFIVLNTCAVREHAELRVLGVVGALKALKDRKPDLVIAVCGCMMQQEHRVREIKTKYRHVDIVFGAGLYHRLPELLKTVLEERRREITLADNTVEILEDLPTARRPGVRGDVTVMYGCDNYCSYCIVPYVRGRERSRAPGRVLGEVRELAAAGTREIMLLGQNVNSYGHDLAQPCSFAQLLRQVCEVPGDFWVRFMTSHPKDASHELFETMAQCKKIAPQLHLPVQSGSDRVLEAMNRRYTAAQYLALVDDLRALMPDIALSSDIIVGFPGESEGEFRETLALIERVRFDNLYTFAYSPRAGTRAAALPDQLSPGEKERRLQALMRAQEKISRERNEALVGSVQRVLVEGASKRDKSTLAGRTAGGKLVHFAGPARENTFVDVKILSAATWALTGVIIE
ncbi:tRNA (N6-isopentenyl adenosine(37)-C2)-methylthiotransferase MiaB [Feifania hominis]|uniref:tRNA-2-methylthio-N(6)-dimethylallyladenosine synthase n=1 Tax=Feifania hominis TaxID=2763660 RepID=A0A926HVB4_9FIRM|nr:tRNA (N6-isopentenyl adenosine(37)-C2)-methylthiotransferase MiaB [Feifania hominis]MBC8536810.1 tRNA (N6-isopentenyl adenosine(37)-C2)-methylthiotransferase MiaB [Feifania hominis]